MPKGRRIEGSNYVSQTEFYRCLLVKSVDQLDNEKFIREQVRPLALKLYATLYLARGGGEKPTSSCFDMAWEGLRNKPPTLKGPWWDYARAVLVVEPIIDTTDVIHKVEYHFHLGIKAIDVSRQRQWLSANPGALTPEEAQGIIDAVSAGSPESGQPKLFDLTSSEPPTGTLEDE